MSSGFVCLILLFYCLLEVAAQPRPCFNVGASFRRWVCDGENVTSIPQFLPDYTTELILQNVDITELETDGFARFQNIQSIVIRKSKLRKIHPYAFRGLPNLKELIIVENSQLDVLATNSFSAINGNRISKHIDLRRNGFTEIQERAFEETRHIRTLDLRLNKVKVIRSKAFTGLYNVVFLHLPESLSKIEPDAFNGLIRVHYMEIVHWKSEFTEPHTFRGLRQVKTLSIHHSHLGELRPQTFGEMETIEFLYIFNTQIAYLTKESFASIHNIRLIVFKWCHISRLHPSILQHILHKLLLLQDNKIACVCDNVWTVATETGLPQNVTKSTQCMEGKFANQILDNVKTEFWESCFPNKRDFLLPEGWSGAPRKSAFWVQFAAVISVVFSIFLLY